MPVQHSVLPMYVHVCVFMCMYVHVCVCMYFRALRQQNEIFYSSAEQSHSAVSATNRISQKHIDFLTKALLTESGLEHPRADAYVSVCPTEPLGLYIPDGNNVFVYHNLLIQVIHTDTCRYIDTCRYTHRHIQMHAHTCTYIHIHTQHTPCHQCPEGVLGWCAGRTRRLSAAVPTQIISDRARGGLAERQVRAGLGDVVTASVLAWANAYNACIIHAHTYDTNRYMHI
jgi:hypothetical protein